MLNFRILGPFDVVDGDRPLALGGPRQRALLAILVLHAGETVTTDRLIDQLWAERPPPTAAKIVQGYVSHLRRVLGEEVLVTRNHGYRLAVASEQVDAGRFAGLVADGRRAMSSGHAAEAHELLAAALLMWRGDALADLAYESFAQAAVVRLEEERLDAIEDRIGAELALGANRELVGELDALVRRYPSRERFLAQLMLVLYRSGRQADALEAYRRGSGALSDELGLQPGIELRTLERQILEQDPVLDPPAATLGNAPAAISTDPAGAVRDVTAAAHAVRAHRLLVVGGVLLLAAAIGAAIMKLAAGHGSPVRVAPNSLAAIDVNSNEVTAAIAVGVQPGAVAYGVGSLWVANVSDQSISRVNPATLQTLQTIPLQHSPTGISVSQGEVWTVTSESGADYVTANAINPAFDTVDHTVKVGSVDPDTAAAIAAAGSRVWVAPFAGDLTELNATSGEVVQRVDPNASPSALADGDGATWLADSEADDVVRVDPTGLMTPIPVGHDPMGIAVGDGGVWVADTGDNAVLRIDPQTDAVTTTIPVGRSPMGVTAGAGSVWVANSDSGTVTRIDPRTDRVIATITVGGSPQEIVVAGRRAWVTVDTPALPTMTPGKSGGTLRVDSAYDVDSMDPAIAYEPLSAQLLYATCVELVNYPSKPGPAGAQLVPEVAQTMPVISSDGRTYRFTIRKGFRFAPPSNQPVTAQTFKYSIERTLNPIMKTPVAAEFDDIVGAKAYIAGKTRHISGVTVRGDQLTIRLTAAAPDFLARLAQPFFCAVPPGTPINPNGVHVIPFAGPYTVQSYTPGQGIVLIRNPNYHGDWPHHFARIEVAVNVPSASAVAAVERGKADYAVDGEIDDSQVRQLAARYGAHSSAARVGHQQYFTYAEPQLDYYDLNTHRPLFSSQRLREAVNYAIDREALAKLGDMHAAVPDVPASEYLPPGIPGHTDVQAYPMTPNLGKARQLASGYAGSKVVLYTCDRLNCSAAAEIIKHDLAAIGLRVVVRTFAVTALYSAYKVPGAAFDMGFVWWSADYPDPDDFLNLLLETSSVLPTFKDPQVRAELTSASRLSGIERYLTYARLDGEIARTAAPFVAVDNSLSHQLFSARIGCEIYQPYYGIDLGALCVRGKA